MKAIVYSPNYLPIQKLAKMFPSSSSDEIVPVSIPK